VDSHFRARLREGEGMTQSSPTAVDPKGVTPAKAGVQWLRVMLRPGSVRGALLIAAAIALSCSIAQAAQAAQAGQTGQSETESKLDAADAVLRQMSGITGLPIKAPLKKQLINRSELRQYLVDNLHAEYSADEMHGEEAALKAFGVVGPDFSLEQFLVSFYTEQAAGFYDPRRKTMFIADWVSPELQQPVLAHELTHALQDQSLDLWKFLLAVRDNDDSSAARQALVEGYATLAMMQTMLGSVPIEKVPSIDAMMERLVNQQMAEFPVFTGAPYFLRFQALFPYVQGLHFSLRGLILGGWKGLNRAFADPPTSTKEIFQPDLYFNGAAGRSNGDTGQAPAKTGAPRETPIALPPPPALRHAAGLRLVEANVMGEIGYDALLGQLISEDEAKKVTGPWVADRYLVYDGSPRGQHVLIARTRWASPEASSAFCSDYRTLLAKRWPEPAREAPSPAGKSSGAANGAPRALLQTAGARQTILLSEGDECRWAEGVPAAEAEAVAKWLESLP
jgi:hypothetical protein